MIHHYTLRLLLWRGGLFPARHRILLCLLRWRILLRQDSGGWISVYQLLLEYFAQLDDDVRGQ